MKPIDASTLSQMTINMLERTAMVLAEPAPPDASLPSPSHVAQIVYSGPSSGSITLAASEGFLRELASSLLGVEPSEVTIESHGHDALREMANIVGGSVLLALAGDQCEYSLGLPALIPAADATTTPASAHAECAVSTESGLLRVQWKETPKAKAA